MPDAGEAYRSLAGDLDNPTTRSDDDMVGLESFSSLLHRQVLRWVEHVSRMPVDRLPKQAMFGWPAGLETQRFHVSVWVNWIFSKCGIPPMHWFAFAQKPARNWIKLINQAIPRPKLKPAQALAVNQWVPSDDIQ